MRCVTTLATFLLWVNSDTKKALLYYKPFHSLSSSLVVEPFPYVASIKICGEVLFVTKIIPKRVLPVPFTLNLQVPMNISQRRVHRVLLIKLLIYIYSNSEYIPQSVSLPYKRLLIYLVFKHTIIGNRGVQINMLYYSFHTGKT